MTYFSDHRPSFVSIGFSLSEVGKVGGEGKLVSGYFLYPAPAPEVVAERKQTNTTSTIRLQLANNGGDGLEKKCHLYQRTLVLYHPSRPQSSRQNVIKARSHG